MKILALIAGSKEELDYYEKKYTAVIKNIFLLRRIPRADSLYGLSPRNTYILLCGNYETSPAYESERYKFIINNGATSVKETLFVGYLKEGLPDFQA